MTEPPRKVASLGAPSAAMTTTTTTATATATSSINTMSRNRIQSIWKAVQQQSQQSKYHRLQQRLRDKRNAVLLAAKMADKKDEKKDNDKNSQEQQKANKTFRFRGLLPKTTMEGRRTDPITGSLKNPLTVVTQKHCPSMSKSTSSSKKSKSCQWSRPNSYTVPVVPFSAATAAGSSHSGGGGIVVRLPTHKFCTMTLTSYRVKDQEELLYVPSALADVLPFHQDPDDDNDQKKTLKKKKPTTRTATSNSTGRSSQQSKSDIGDQSNNDDHNNPSPPPSAAAAAARHQPQPAQNKRTQQYFDLFKTKQREREIENGPLYKQQERNENIRQVMQQIQVIQGHHEAVTTSNLHPAAAAAAEEQEQDAPQVNQNVVVATNELIALVANALRMEPRIVREAVVMGSNDENNNNSDSASTSSSLSSQQEQEEEPKKKKNPPPPPKQQHHHHHHRKAPPPSSSNGNGNTLYCGKCIDNTNAAQSVQQEEETAYLKLQDSLRHLWCPRCYIYDCSLHHVNNNGTCMQPAKPSLQLSLELGWLRERQQQVQHEQQQRNSSTMTMTSSYAAAAAAPLKYETDENTDVNVTTTTYTKAASSRTATAVNNNYNNCNGLMESNSRDDDNDEEMKSSDKMQGLTSFHMSIAHRYYVIFQGDVEKMAIVMQAPLPALAHYIKTTRGFVLPREENKLQQPKRKGYYSTRNYNQKWVKEIANDSSNNQPAFQPCVHDAQVCNPDVCSCIQQHQFCTKFCAWRNQSKNFFRGCECKSDCGPSCSCNVHGRECDPDLCRCDACTDPPGPHAATALLFGGKTTTTTQLCRNDNVTMRRGVPLMVGISEIPNAGFGVFSKHDLAAGTFLGEYVGEIISQDEAERRGQLYDMRNHSCLFNFSSDLVIDADARASRLRYLNHSTTPNCEPKLINVAGGTRIAFFTLKKIATQTELTFNYSYDEILSTSYASFIHRSASVVQQSAKEAWFRGTVTENVNETKKKGDNNNNATSKKKRKSRPSKRGTSNKKASSSISLTAATAKKMDSKPSPTTTSGPRRTGRQLKPPPPAPPI